MEMVKILNRVVEWMHSKWSGPTCYFCGARESEESPNFTCAYEDVLVCRRCLSQPMALYALDMLYWAEHPETVPPCRHCGKVVPREQLSPNVLPDWYFCHACDSNDDVILYWKRIRRRMMERRLAANGLGRKG
jgi:hypothetical protein